MEISPAYLKMKFLAFLFVATLRGKNIPDLDNNLDEETLRLKLLAYQNATSISRDSNYCFGMFICVELRWFNSESLFGIGRFSLLISSTLL